VKTKRNELHVSRRIKYDQVKQYFHMQNSMLLRQASKQIREMPNELRERD